MPPGEGGHTRIERIAPVERTRDYRPDLTIDLPPYTVAVVEISAR